MVDFSFIGKEGLIIQYEDIVSLIGFNVVKYFRSKNVNDKACKMSVEDILLSYFNRTTEDVSTWLKSEFDIDLDVKDYLNSVGLLQPNVRYAYKIFDSAYKNGIKNLIIHSNLYSPVIEQFVGAFPFPVKYTHGDIVSVLNNNMNATFITSSPSNIEKCLDVKVPFALTIVDDYMYLADLVTNKFDEKLRKQNVFVLYTSIISAGIIS